MLKSLSKKFAIILWITFSNILEKIVRKAIGLQFSEAALKLFLCKGYIIMNIILSLFYHSNSKLIIYTSGSLITST